MPTADATFTANTPVTVANKTAGANSNVTYNLLIPSGDLNFSAIITNTPAAGFVAPGPGNPGFVGGTHPALGAVLGTQFSGTTLGLTNNPCSNTLTVVFTLLNATVDISDGNLILDVPQAATQTGTGGILDNQWDDAGRSNTGPGAVAPWNGPWDSAAAIAQGLPGSAGLTVAEQANGIPAQVERYPKYLRDMFTPDGGSPVQPLARMAGASNVSGTSIMLNYVLFAPDALPNAFPPPHPFSDLKGLGTVSVAVLNNPEADAAPGSITDFCSELTVNTTPFGLVRPNACIGVTSAPCNTDEGISKPCQNNGVTDTCTPLTPGLARYANPSTTGTHLYTAFNQSLRDLDGDGVENALDTCPQNAADGLDPRSGAGPDTDADGIANACDTNGNGNTDQDSDGWLNRGDNCPQANNPTNTESERSATQLAAAKKGGTKTDGLGDACDPNPGIADGAFETTFTVTPVCIGGTDVDGDGWCAAAGPASPASLNDPNDGSTAITPEDYDLVYAMGVTHSGSGATPPMRQPVQVCNDGIDNDGDTLIDTLDQGSGSSTCRPKGVGAHPGYPACPAAGCPNIDSDGDGFTDEIERHVGTDALARCGAGAVPAQSVAWPADFASGGIPNSTDRLTVTDLTSFLAPARRLDTSPGDANFNVRWDLTPGPGLFAKWVNVNDLTALIAGPTGNPPMPPYSGTKAFGSASLCTNGPMD